MADSPEASTSAEQLQAAEEDTNEETNEIVLINVKPETDSDSNEQAEDDGEETETTTGGVLQTISKPTDVHARLSTEQVREIFADPESYSVDGVPIEPEAGTVYCIDRVEHPNWHKDGYSWKAHPSYIETDDPNLKVKLFIKSGVSKTLEKCVYSLAEYEPLLCIQYRVPESVNVKQEKKRKGLTIDEAVALLENCDETISAARAIRPKGGELYLFNTDIMGDDWKCDDYIWRNCGTAFLPSKNPVIKKTFFSIRTPATGDKGSTAFQKVAYVALDKQNIVLVQYIGDESVYVPMTHGNRKRGAVEHKRTCPSVLEKIKAGFQHDQDMDSFKTFSGSSSDTPRNIQQLNNFKHRLKKRKLTENPNSSTSKAAKLSPENDISEILVFDDQGNPVLPPGYEIVQVSTIDENNVEQEIPLEQLSQQGLPDNAKLQYEAQNDEVDDSQNTDDLNASYGQEQIPHEIEHEPVSMNIEPEDLMSQGDGAIPQQQGTNENLDPEQPDPEPEIDVAELQKQLREKQQNIKKLQQKKLRLELETLNAHDGAAVQQTVNVQQQPSSSVHIIQQPKSHQPTMRIIQQQQQQRVPETIEFIQQEPMMQTAVMSHPGSDQNVQQTLYTMDGGMTYTVGDYTQDPNHATGQNVVYVQDFDGSEQVVVIQEPAGQ